MNHTGLQTLRWVLLVVWAVVSFGSIWFARELSGISWWGWPLHYWIAAQGAVVIFLLIVVVDVWAHARVDLAQPVADEEVDSSAKSPSLGPQEDRP